MGWLHGHLLKQINPVVPPTSQKKEKPLLKQNREFFQNGTFSLSGGWDKIMQRRHIYVLNLEPSGS